MSTCPHGTEPYGGTPKAPCALCEAERPELEHMGDPEKKTGIYAPRSPIEPRRVDQTELGPLGNCQSACLSMLIGVPLAEIPNFAAIAKGDGNVFFHRQNDWLNARGWGLLTIVRHQALPWPPKHGWYIAGGASPRGNRHAVVFKDGALWHDPHPEHGGIGEVEDVDILYPLRPFARSSALPSEPTRAMLDAWWDVMRGIGRHRPSTVWPGLHYSDSESLMVDAYRAMLDAAPMSAELLCERCPKCNGDQRGAPCAYPEACVHPCRTYIAERNQALLAAASSNGAPASQFTAMAWGDRIRDEQLDELLARAEKSETVLLRIDQFRDLVLQAKSASENEPRLWKSRIDCWYEPHRDPGAKVKPNKRVVRYVILEAPTSDEAVTRAVEWAERTADCSKGRRWLSFEHRQTGPFKIPQEVKE